ncbi:hypothetical protein H5410_036441 [Solanum commersonii]|uniref:Uncharacterized protein n=1 Tax=Solanum commersonii TaxID=4109 RepID=A0A9J5Y481_SOLCO|nr:hypothetical protein H5410_036441 [Solanum commersonii]
MDQDHQDVFNPRKIYQNYMHESELAYLKKQVVDEGEFVVQCGRYFKWQNIPTKERYETNKGALTPEWRPNISCDDTPDISQYESKLWAFNKPSIPQFAFKLSDERCIIT